MKLSIYQVDAFTNKLFGGNPAAVIPLHEWLDEELMQKIATENNLSETVFFVPSADPAVDFDIRWFTPAAEINHCGHATLASAYVLFKLLAFKGKQIRFSCKSGILTVTKNSGLITMDFPSWKPSPADHSIELLNSILGEQAIAGIYKHRDLLVEFENEDAVKNCSPDFSKMKKHFDKIIITARGNDVDFVSRFFAPGVGIDEDPVTGSAHSQLIPFWSEKSGKKKLHALQLSQRGGELWCEQISEDRVTMSGEAVFYMQGEILLG
jgi:PhzF family phenazine biosynthesis protein